MRYQAAPVVRDDKVVPFLDDILPDTALVRDGRILANPVSIVNAASEMLGKMAVDMPVDPVLTRIRIENYLIHHAFLFILSTVRPHQAKACTTYPGPPRM